LDLVSVEAAAGQSTEAGHDPVPTKRDQPNLSFEAWLEPHGRTSRNGQSAAPCRFAVEREGLVGLGKMEMRPDLNRPIGRIGDDDHPFGIRPDVTLLTLDYYLTWNERRAL
jgi:hypothetical protein